MISRVFPENQTHFLLAKPTALVDGPTFVLKREYALVDPVPVDGWNLYTVHLDANMLGMTSFAFHYVGPYDSADYIGVDTLTVRDLPEPTSTALFAAGLLGLGALRRRTRG